MRIFERRVVFRFVVSAARGLAVLGWLAVFFHLPRILGTGGSLLEAVASPRLLASLLLSGEIALLLAAPLAMYRVITDLQGAGILTVFLATRSGHGRLRRGLVGAAGLTVLAAMVLFQASSALTAGPRRETRGRLWPAGPVTVWCPDAPPGARRLQDVFLFRQDRLDVSRARAATISADARTLEIPAVEALVGEPIRLPRLSLKHGRRSLLLFPPPSAWLSGAVSGWDVLVSLNRVLTPGILVLALAYLVLLVPFSRRRRALLAFLLLLPFVCTGMLWCSLGMWRHALPGLAAEGAWLAFLAGLIVVLDRLLARRGLRLA